MGQYLEKADRALEAIKTARDRPGIPNDINDLNDRSHVHGIPVSELRTAAGDDWPEVAADPELLECLARAVQTRRMRECGIVPAHYTATTTCAHCGPVLIFPGTPARVMHCPWCLNRKAGKPVPRVKP